MTLSVDSLKLERVERLPDHDGSFITEFRTKVVQQRDGVLIQPDLHRQPPKRSLTLSADSLAISGSHSAMTSCGDVAQDLPANGPPPGGLWTGA
jgi:hypothetical protein